MRNSSWISSSTMASIEIITQCYYGNRINYINNSDCWCPRTHTGEVNYKKECHHAFPTLSMALAFIRWTEHREKERNMMGPSASNNYGNACFWFLIEKILVGYTYIISLLYNLVPYLQTEPTVDWTYLMHSCIGTEHIQAFFPCVVRGRNGQCGSFNRSIPSRSGCCLEYWAGSHPTVRYTQWKRQRLISDGCQGLWREFRWFASRGAGPMLSEGIPFHLLGSGN